MAEQGAEEGLNPLVRPRAIRLLKKRPKLVDFGLREEVLEQLDQNICKRREPEEIAERTVKRAFNEGADAAAPPVRERIRSRFESANQGILEDL